MLNIEIQIWLTLLGIIVIIPFLLFLRFTLIRIIIIWKSIYSKSEHRKNLRNMKKQLIKKSLNKHKIDTKEEKQPTDTSNQEILKNRLERIKIEAIVFKEKGNIEAYEKKLVEWLSLNKDHLEFIRMLGDLYFSIRNYKKSLPLLKKVIENEEKDHKTIWQIWLIYLDKEDYDTAKLLINKAIEIKPDNPKYYVSLAEILYNSDEIDEAIKIIEKVLKLRPSNVNYLLALASLYEEKSDNQNARKYYFKALENDPTSEIAKDKLELLW